MQRSTNTLATSVKIGLFVSVCLVLLGGGVLIIGQSSRFFQATRTVSVILPHAQSLKVGAPVRLAGIEVGAVDDLALLDDPQQHGVRATLSVEESAIQRLRADARAMLRSPGLWGEQYVELMPGHKEQAWRQTQQPLEGKVASQPGEVVSSVESALESLQGILQDIQVGQGSLGKLIEEPELYNSFVRLSSELNRMVQAINQSTGTLRLLLRSEVAHEHMTALLQHANEVVEQLQSTRGTIGKLIYDSNLHNQTIALLQELQRATTQVNMLLADLNGAEGTAGKFVNDTRLYEEGLQAIHRFESTAQRLDRILARLENGTGSAGLLLADAALYRNVNDLITNVNLLVQDIRHRPERYLQVKVF